MTFEVNIFRYTYTLDLNDRKTYPTSFNMVSATINVTLEAIWLQFSTIFQIRMRYILPVVRDNEFGTIWIRSIQLVSHPDVLLMPSRGIWCRLHCAYWMQPNLSIFHMCGFACSFRFDEYFLVFWGHCWWKWYCYFSSNSWSYRLSYSLKSMKTNWFFFFWFFIFFF